MSCGSTATYPRSRGRANTRERGKVLCAAVLRPLRITSLESTRGHALFNSCAFPKAHLLTVLPAICIGFHTGPAGGLDELSLDAVEKIPAGRCGQCCCPRRRLDHPGRPRITRPKHHHRAGQCAHHCPSTRPPRCRPRLCATTAVPRTADSHTRPGHLAAPDPHPTSAGIGCPQTAQIKNSAASTSRPAVRIACGTCPRTD